MKLFKELLYWLHYLVKLMAGISFIVVTADPLLKMLADIRTTTAEPYGSVFFWAVAIGWFYLIIRLLLWLFKDLIPTKKVDEIVKIK
jgi:hypothetical protein